VAKWRPKTSLSGLKKSLYSRSRIPLHSYQG